MFCLWVIRGGPVAAPLQDMRQTEVRISLNQGCVKNLTGKSKTDETDVEGSHVIILRAPEHLGKHPRALLQLTRYNRPLQDILFNEEYR